MYSDQPQYRPYREENYPHDAEGSCLVMGTPDVDRANEPVAIDVVRTALYALIKTRANLDNEDAHTRIEVIGAMPRALSARPDPTLIMRLGDESDPTGEIKILREIEQQRANVLRAIADEYMLNDLDVYTLTEKLIEPDRRGDFISGFQTGRINLGTTLNVERKEMKGGRERTKNVPLVLKQGLIELVPHWLRNKAADAGARQEPDTDTLDKLINYALVEMLLIIRKVTRNILYFHYPRERRYLPLTRAYMEQCLCLGGAKYLIDRYIRMPRKLDGEKLVLAKDVSHSKSLPADALRRLSMCEPYRVAPGQESRRLLIHPSDDVNEMKAKILSADILDSQRYQVVEDMIVLILKMVRHVTWHQSGMRRRMAQLLPDRVLEDKDKYPENLERILRAFYELVTLPLSDAIERRGEGGVPTPSEDPPELDREDEEPHTSGD